MQCGNTAHVFPITEVSANITASSKFYHGIFFVSLFTKELLGGVPMREYLGTLYASVYQGEAESGEAEREIAGRQTCRIRLTGRTDRFRHRPLREIRVLYSQST